MLSKSDEFQIILNNWALLRTNVPVVGLQNCSTWFYSTTALLCTNTVFVQSTTVFRSEGQYHRDIQHFKSMSYERSARKQILYGIAFYPRGEKFLKRLLNGPLWIFIIFCISFDITLTSPVTTPTNTAICK